MVFVCRREEKTKSLDQEEKSDPLSAEQDFWSWGFLCCSEIWNLLLFSGMGSSVPVDLLSRICNFWIPICLPSTCFWANPSIAGSEYMGFLLCFWLRLEDGFFFNWCSGWSLDQTQLVSLATRFAVLFCCSNNYLFASWWP